MLPSEVLRRARELVAGGWHEPLSLDAHGWICSRDDEGLTRVCLHDALLLGARDDVTAMMDAEAHVVAQLRRLGWHEALYRWLEHPKRTQDDVLLLLAQAHNHARAQESRAA